MRRIKCRESEDMRIVHKIYTDYETGNVVKTDSYVSGGSPVGASDRDYVMVFDSNVAGSLTVMEFGFIFYCMQRFRCTDMWYLGGGFIDDFNEDCGSVLEDSYVRRIPGNLVKKGALIGTERRGCYFINPLVFWKGRIETRKWFIVNVYSKFGIESSVKAEKGTRALNEAEREDDKIEEL